MTVGLLGLVFPPLLVLPLRWINPATTAFMVQHWVTSAAPYYHWTDWDDISPHAPVAVIAAEDQTFFEHRGVLPQLTVGVLSLTYLHARVWAVV